MKDRTALRYVQRINRMIDWREDHIDDHRGVNSHTLAEIAALRFAETVIRERYDLDENE